MVPLVFLGTDERGCTTVAKLVQQQIEGGRSISHNRTLSQHESVKADEDSLPDLKKRFNLSASEVPMNSQHLSRVIHIIYNGTIS